MCTRRCCLRSVSACLNVTIDSITDMFLLVDGYVNENGVINTKRLQVILDEMAEWEREVFEKEFADLNWYKGKQAKHVKEMELARKRSKLGMQPTPSYIVSC